VTRVGIIGASGFTGAELLRLAAGHPDFEVVVAAADSQAGTPVGALYPSLAAAWPDLTFAPTDAATVERCAGLDLVFLGLPHGASQDLMPSLLEGGATVVDLAADFRLADPADYTAWYGEDHHAPELLEGFVYGLPETAGDALAGATRIAAAGCYPTATALALAPLLEGGLVATDGIIVDAASGVSGAGRAPKDNTTFAAVDSNFTAYGLLTHRHTPEMEQSVSRLAGVDREHVRLLFTPHLAPMSRGILATCYARPSGHLPTTDELLTRYRSRYAGNPFVLVTDEPPTTKATLGANTAHVTVRSDPRTGWVVALCAIDNLVKGASGQAVQCANLALGLEETAGLPLTGVHP
jgi:N-acetyl-gamma-glutamyl-phosphate reductase